MARTKEQQPEMFILAGDARGVYQRFHGWPDTYLRPEFWAKLVTDPLQLSPEVRSLLQSKGILNSEPGTCRLTLPIYEQLPTEQWRRELYTLASPHLADLKDCIGLLQHGWSQQRLPAWPELAHGLLIGYLLWGVGGQMLLNQYGAQAGAVVVDSLAESAGTWLGFVRANQQFGVSCLLGTQYAAAMDIREALNKPDVLQALATLRADGTLLAATPIANRILNRLSGLRNDRKEDGSQTTTWPTLEASQLHLIKQDLLIAAQAMHLLFRQTVVPLVASATAELQLYLPVDLALVAYALLVDVLAEDWESTKLLPAKVQPILSGLV